MATEQCRNCRFSKGPKRSTPFLFCRRYPPTHQGESEAAFPLVPYDEWCGEWLALRPGAGLPAEIAPPKAPKPGAARKVLVTQEKRRIVEGPAYDR